MTKRAMFRKDITGHIVSKEPKKDSHLIGFFRNGDHVQDTCVSFH